ncbi:hypothetical protein D7Y09_12480 [bacterium 1XD42-1]|nr:hypothetical protein D7X25_11760 [bacterium 1XD42-8]RKJ63057.1 hypothetical protein D7Y09_12480 [bacterium 1XD42-1]
MLGIPEGSAITLEYCCKLMMEYTVLDSAALYPAQTLQPLWAKKAPAILPGAMSYPICQADRVRWPQLFRPAPRHQNSRAYQAAGQLLLGALGLY